MKQAHRIKKTVFLVGCFFTPRLTVFPPDPFEFGGISYVLVKYRYFAAYQKQQLST